mgnify:CR=1 FL=1
MKKVRELAIGVIEYKRNDKSIEQVFSSQIRASIKEPENPFVLGIYYDTGRARVSVPFTYFASIGSGTEEYTNSITIDLNTTDT